MINCTCKQYLRMQTLQNAVSNIVRGHKKQVLGTSCVSPMSYAQTACDYRPMQDQTSVLRNINIHRSSLTCMRKQMLQLSVSKSRSISFLTLCLHCPLSRRDVNILNVNISYNSAFHVRCIFMICIHNVVVCVCHSPKKSTVIKRT